MSNENNIPVYPFKGIDFTAEEINALLRSIPNKLDRDLVRDGKSAYDVAVQNGYTGTVTEWLQSLRGQKGDALTYSDLTDEQKQELKQPAIEAGNEVREQSSSVLKSNTQKTEQFITKAQNTLDRVETEIREQSSSVLKSNTEKTNELIKESEETVSDLQKTIIDKADGVLNANTQKTNQFIAKSEIALENAEKASEQAIENSKTHWLPTLDSQGNLSWSRSSSTVAPATKNIKGPQGNSGVSGSTDNIEVVNDLNGGESTPERIKVLSAEQGKVLNNKYSEVDKKINEFNISRLYPTNGTGGTNKYTLEGAIAQVPAEYRVPGLKVTFVNENGDTETWEYKRGSWVVSSFSEVGAKKFSDLDYRSNTFFIPQAALLVDGEYYNQKGDILSLTGFCRYEGIKVDSNSFYVVYAKTNGAYCLLKDATGNIIKYITGLTELEALLFEIPDKENCYLYISGAKDILGIYKLNIPNIQYRIDALNLQLQTLSKSSVIYSGAINSDGIVVKNSNRYYSNFVAVDKGVIYNLFNLYNDDNVKAITYYDKNFSFISFEDLSVSLKFNKQLDTSSLPDDVFYFRYCGNQDAYCYLSVHDIENGLNAFVNYQRERGLTLYKSGDLLVSDTNITDGYINNKNKVINLSGWWHEENFIPVSPGMKLTVNASVSTTAVILFYNYDKQVVATFSTNNVTVPQGAYYMRFSMQKRGYSIMVTETYNPFMTLFELINNNSSSEELYCNDRGMSEFKNDFNYYNNALTKGRVRTYPLSKSGQFNIISIPMFNRTGIATLRIYSDNTIIYTEELSSFNQHNRVYFHELNKTLQANEGSVIKIEIVCSSSDGLAILYLPIDAEIGRQRIGFEFNGIQAGSPYGAIEPYLLYSVTPDKDLAELNKYSDRGEGGFEYLLPQSLYLAQGITMDFYFDNIILPKERQDIGRYDVILTEESYSYKQMLTHIQKTGTSGTAKFVVNVFDKLTQSHHKLISTIRMIEKNALSGQVLNLLLIGDSIMEGGVFTNAVCRLLEQNGIILHNLGTLPGIEGYKDYKHEGRGSWSTETYLTQRQAANNTNPFLDDNNNFSLQYYYNTNKESHFPEATGVDIVGIELGMNDVGQTSGTADYDAIINRFKTLIEQIRSPEFGYPDCSIVIILTPWGAKMPTLGSYATGQGGSFLVDNAVSYAIPKKMLTLGNRLIADLSSYDKLYFAPCYLHVDRELGYGQTEVLDSTHITIPRIYAKDLVHPETNGRLQMADCIYSTVLYAIGERTGLKLG